MYAYTIEKQNRAE